MRDRSWPHTRSLIPIVLRPTSIEDPPQTFVAIFRRIGPGLILAGSIVGSGELIATTVLGAENGYLLLWLILISCVIKTVVQEELGRYAIGTGETTLEAFESLPRAAAESFLAGVDVVHHGHVHADADRRDAGQHLGDSQPRLPAIPMAAWPWLLAAVTAVLLHRRAATAWSKKCPWRWW